MLCIFLEEPLRLQDKHTVDSGRKTALKRKKSSVFKLKTYSYIIPSLHLILLLLWSSSYPTALHEPHPLPFPLFPPLPHTTLLLSIPGTQP